LHEIVDQRCRLRDVLLRLGLSISRAFRSNEQLADGIGGGIWQIDDDRGGAAKQHCWNGRLQRQLHEPQRLQADI
jgi:hypothetical protein